MLAGVIAAVVFVSLTIGLASPDGSVGQARSTATPKTAVPVPSPTPAATSIAPATASAARAPASVRGPWPGRPDAATLDGSTVDWCLAVRTSNAAKAEAVFGRAAVRAAACAAVRFVFEQRYSRLSLPRPAYTATDFGFVLSPLAPATVAAYRPRIDRFVSDPGSRAARDRLGLVLLRGVGTSSGAAHASAGRGRVFYGKAFTTTGYRDRAVWINPRFSRVAIRVDRAKAKPRIVATFTASAAVPVFDTSARRHDMLTVPTRALFYVRLEESTWKIGGWDIHDGKRSYARLAVR